MSDEHEPIEGLLRRYRPAGPPAGLRERVLSAAAVRQVRPGARRRAMRLWWASAAAMLLLTIGLQAATRGVEQRLAAQLTADRQPAWPAEAERAVRMLGGGEAAQRYVELALAARPRRAASPPTYPPRPDWPFENTP